jgi:outer membrane protein assembly factor BamA
MPMALDLFRQTLQDEGFYQPKMTDIASPQATAQQMDIAVQVDPGERAKVGAITLTNQTPFPEADLRGRLKLKPGTEITSQRLGNGSENVRKWLVDRHYLGARASIERGRYDHRATGAAAVLCLPGRKPECVEGEAFSSTQRRCCRFTRKAR